MPMSSPRALISAPPELPRLIAASVWMKSSYSENPLECGARRLRNLDQRQIRRLVDAHDAGGRLVAIAEDDGDFGIRAADDVAVRDDVAVI